MKNIIERMKNLNRTAKILLIGAVLFASVVIVLLIVFSGSGKSKLSVETSLKEIIVSSKLRTCEYTYNSIVEVKDGEKTKYHVAYKGTVNAGFDFEKVEIVRDGKKILVVIPDVEILEVLIDPELDYIFVKDKYDTEQTYAEATNACRKDLETKAVANETLLQTARESAEDTLSALIKPFERQLDDGETFEIVFDTNGG